jgi:hypothetical protein
MRALIHLPIIHGNDDLGSLGPAVTDAREPAQAEQRQAAVEHFWTLLETTIEGFGLNYETVRIYQDGLPVCGKELEIVSDTAQAGSRNFRLLKSLIAKGATLMGTEAPELLLEEYALMRQVHAPQPGVAAPTPAAAKALLDRRDAFIAQRIDDTLNDEEMGLLFIGLLHNVEAYLPKDITVIQPLGKPKS